MTPGAQTCNLRGRVRWTPMQSMWMFAHGVLVGMARPLGMIRQHDMRDWHQRQTKCPPHPSHRAGLRRV
ncbi:hypothetical protein L0664_17055 [Octadecabacter sp. G9-8]|uniref:Uncharacterized protein n=1 Tax=Octadecabacter dasysiphoniae TaxID=2909341 RepID=A0ABS9CZZ0_9RHOB|nr:hypothetical protein [Octadecabacter dasysiphoniae]